MGSKMRILGIDPGLVNTGWGVIDSKGSALHFIACGTVKTRSLDPMEKRLGAIYTALCCAIRQYGVQHCAIEGVFVNKNSNSSLLLGQARGVAMVVAFTMGLSIREYQNRIVKKSITGIGSADKNQMQAMVKILLPGAVMDSEHSADALAVAITHAHMDTSAISQNIV